MIRSLSFTSFLLLLALVSRAQVTGGQSVLVGTTLENSPIVTSLGGYVVSNPDSDVNLFIQNPALLDSGWHKQISVNHLSYYAQTNSTNIAYAHYLPRLQTTFATAFLYQNYGNFRSTDETGRILGDFNAVDYMWQVSASRHYRDRWRYGASLKLAGARYDDYSSFAILLDGGVHYIDTARGLSIGLTAKNIGGQLKKFNTHLPSEPVPFDMQIGLTKKFAHIPFRLGVTAHHFFRWNIRYDDPALRNDGVLFIDPGEQKEKSYFFDKFFRHFVFSGELLMSKRIGILLAYNHLRRSELSLSQVRGLSGFSMGFNLNYRKWSLRYGKAVYNQVGGTNHIGLNLNLGEF